HPSRPGTTPSCPRSTPKKCGAKARGADARLIRYDNETIYPKKQGKPFFFVNKKEAKKTLLIWVCGCENARDPD
ncbi:hypothetical protein AruPA_00005, partial [Acidiphilium sp. PA]|uniref:hypothetical protein n=1 Tax=Acidiphilium sp. PA TaxID=2871705 RepID=UPI0022435C2F